jgi:hypothetical protein
MPRTGQNREGAKQKGQPRLGLPLFSNLQTVSADNSANSLRGAASRGATTRRSRSRRRSAATRRSRLRSCARRSGHMMHVVMNMMMHHVTHTPPRSPAHGLLRDSLSAISRRLGIVGRLLGAASCRLSLRRCRLSTLRSRIRARGCLIGLIGRVDGVLLRRWIARGTATSHYRQKQKRAGQPDQL